MRLFLTLINVVMEIKFPYQQTAPNSACEEMKIDFLMLLFIYRKSERYNRHQPAHLHL